MKYRNNTANLLNIDEIRAANQVDGNNMMEAHFNDVRSSRINKDHLDECLQMPSKFDHVVQFEAWNAHRVRIVLETTKHIANASEGFWKIVSLFLYLIAPKSQNGVRYSAEHA